MRRTRNWQKLGQTLDRPENNGVKKMWHRLQCTGKNEPRKYGLTLMPVRGSISIKFFHIQPLQEDTMRREQMRKAGGLYPPIAEPNRSGFMPVSGGHEIYWEECGNPDGQPILFLHGGPGGGITKEDRQWFDPQKWRIILFDQRGCGQSTPLCELKENTTWDLVEDIWQLLKMLEIKKVTLY